MYKKYIELLSAVNSKSHTIKTITIFVVYFSFVKSCLTVCPSRYIV